MAQTPMPIPNAEALQTALMGCAILAISLTAYSALPEGSSNFQLSDVTEGLPCVASFFEALGFFWLSVELEARPSLIAQRTLEAYLLVFVLRACMLCYEQTLSSSAAIWLFEVNAMLKLFQHMRRLSTTSSSDSEVKVGKFLIPVCLIATCLLHPEVSESSLYNFVWTVCHYLGAFALVPQALLMKQWRAIGLGHSSNGAIQIFAAIMAIARVFDAAYWIKTFDSLDSEDGGFNLSGYIIVGVHALGFLVIAAIAHFAGFGFCSGFLSRTKPTSFKC